MRRELPISRMDRRVNKTTNNFDKYLNQFLKIFQKKLRRLEHTPAIQGVRLPAKRTVRGQARIIGHCVAVAVDIRDTRSRDPARIRKAG